MVLFQEFISKKISTEPHFMVVGHPIGHSLSPLMHSIAIDTHKINAGYIAIDLPPGDISSFVSWINKDVFLGANITIPYKREFLEVVDRLDVTAEEVGAMNTIVKDEHFISGYNTDVDGFLSPLKPFFGRLTGESVIIFGTGGASRAVKYALKQLDVEQLVIVSRNPGDLDAGDDIICNYQNWQAYAEESVMLVNSTPLGMHPYIDKSPVSERDGYLLEGKICYDLVYNPLKTTFLKQAEQTGAETIAGLQMFIAQGARAFELWTGKLFPEEKIRKTLEQRLKP
jgi:shikimate dehydrogenase